MLLCLHVVTAQTEESLFKANSYYPYLNQIIDVEVADLTGDGLPDLVIASNQEDGIKIYKNTPSGQFIERFDSPKVPTPNPFGNGLESGQHLTIFDVENDGDMDIWVSRLVVEEGFPDQLWLNDGSGQFSIVSINQPLGQGTDSSFLLKGDIDLDGDIDIIKDIRRTATTRTHEMYLNNGDSTFEHARFILDESEVVAGVSEISGTSHLADFNGDDYPDLWYVKHDLWVYLNNQSGGFESEPIIVELGLVYTHPLNENAVNESVLFKDIDNDGDIDIQAFSLAEHLPRRINNGDGTFSQNASVFYPEPPAKQKGQFIDYNGDNVFDLWVSSTRDDEGFVAVSGQDGMISFAGNDHIPIGDNFVGFLAAIDLNQDGKEDVLSLTERGLNVWYKNADQNFSRTEQKQLTSNIGWVFDVKHADVNQDNLPDLIQSNQKIIEVRLGVGGGDFGPAKETTVLTNGYFELVDFNGDGISDILTGHGNDVVLHQGTASGGFEETSRTSVGTYVYQLSTEDFDSDGDLDFLVMDYFSSIRVFENRENDVFALKTELNGLYTSARFINLNQEVRGQIVAFDFINNTHIELVYEQGTFVQNRIIPTGDANPFINGPVIVDFDNDGDLDLLSFQDGSYFDELLLITNDVDTFNTSTIDFPQNYIPIASVDLNNDGLTDIVANYSLRAYINDSCHWLVGVECEDISPWNVFFNKPEGGFEHRPILGMGYGASGTQGLSFFDIDTDGDIDMVTNDISTGQQTWLNTLIDQDFSGMWFNPSENGHGLQLEEITFNGSKGVNFSWFVYHEGNPFWLVGQAPIEGNKSTVQVSYTRGADFGAGFNAADVEVLPWGEVELELLNNNNLKLGWSTQLNGFTNGQLEMVRLTTLKQTTAESRVLNTCHSGSWFNPDENGHGLMVEVIEQEGIPQMTMAWYHYQGGEQFWLVAKGPIHGRKAQLTAYNNSGNEFPPNFDSSLVITEEWGEIEFELLDNYSAKISWNSFNPSFQSGSLSLSKLSQIDRYRCH